MVGENDVHLGKPWEKQDRNEGETQATEFSSPFLHTLPPGLQGKSYQVRVSNTDSTSLSRQQSCAQKAPHNPYTFLAMPASAKRLRPSAFPTYSSLYYEPSPTTLLTGFRDLWSNFNHVGKQGGQVEGIKTPGLIRLLLPPPSSGSPC